MAQHDRSKASALDDIKQADRVAREYARNVQLSVAIARGRGATWEEVGDVLNITKQAAQQRFHAMSDPPNQ